MRLTAVIQYRRGDRRREQQAVKPPVWPATTEQTHNGPYDSFYPARDERIRRAMIPDNPDEPCTHHYQS